MQNENNPFKDESKDLKPYDIMAEPPKFIRISHGVKMYSLSRPTLLKHVREAGVLFKIGGIKSV